MDQHKCLLCDQFIDAEGLDLHITQDHFKVQAYHCLQCDFKCSTSDSLKNHFQETDHGDVLEVVELPKSSSYLTDLVSLISTSCQAASVLGMTEILSKLPATRNTAATATSPHDNPIDPGVMPNNSVITGGNQSEIPVNNDTDHTDMGSSNETADVYSQQSQQQGDPAEFPGDSQS